MRLLLNHYIPLAEERKKKQVNELHQEENCLKVEANKDKLSCLKAEE